MFWLLDLAMWVHASFLLVVFLLVIEGGFRIGLRKRRASKDAGEAASPDVTLAPLLALLGLMLAFTYAYASESGRSAQAGDEQRS